MKLILPTKIGKFNVDRRFIKWLEKYIKYQIIKNTDNKYLLELDKMIEESQLLEEFKVGDVKFNSKKAILLSINCLQCVKIKDSYHISINNNINFPGYALPLENICKLINFGTLNIKGFPIYTNAFNNIVVNLPRYFTRYYYN